MDPNDPRRAGDRRLRLATAAVAGGALVGTGALTVVVASEHPAAAAETSSTSTSGSAGTSGSTGEQDQHPARPGGFGGSSGGGSHASSGGS